MKATETNGNGTSSDGWRRSTDGDFEASELVEMLPRDLPALLGCWPDEQAVWLLDPGLVDNPLGIEDALVWPSLATTSSRQRRRRTDAGRRALEVSGLIGVAGDRWWAQGLGALIGALFLDAPERAVWSVEATHEGRQTTVLVRIVDVDGHALATVEEIDDDGLHTLYLARTDVVGPFIAASLLDPDEPDLLETQPGSRTASTDIREPQARPSVPPANRPQRTTRRRPQRTTARTRPGSTTTLDDVDPNDGRETAGDAAAGRLRDAGAVHGAHGEVVSPPADGLPLEVVSIGTAAARVRSLGADQRTARVQRPGGGDDLYEFVLVATDGTDRAILVVPHATDHTGAVRELAVADANVHLVFAELAELLREWSQDRLPSSPGRLGSFGAQQPATDLTA